MNYINHPTAEMHELFASELYKALIDDPAAEGENDSTMYRGV